MKILNIITSLGSGGAENLIKESLPIMKERGLEPEILLLSSKNNVFEDELRSKGIIIHETGLDNVYSPKQIFEIRKIMDNYDLIHTHLFQPQYWTAFSKMLSRSKVPMVTTEHSTNNRRRAHKIFRVMDRIVYNKYDKIICISKETKNELVKWQPSIGSKATIIHNGIDLEKFDNAKPYKKEELIKNIKNNEKLILMVSRFSIQKDHETVVKAFELLPDDYHIIFVGDGDLKGQIISLTKELGISNRVHFLGYRNDVERIVKTVDIYVQSSHWEGFGIAALEAMASEIPVIASDVAGLSEVVDDGGVLFPKGDHISLANEIKNIFSSKEKYNKIAKKCKEKSGKFSIDKMIDNYVKIYSELLNIGD